MMWCFCTIFAVARPTIETLWLRWWGSARSYGLILRAMNPAISRVVMRTEYGVVGVNHKDWAVLKNRLLKPHIILRIYWSDQLIHRVSLVWRVHISITLCWSTTFYISIVLQRFLLDPLPSKIILATTNIVQYHCKRIGRTPEQKKSRIASWMMRWARRGMLHQRGYGRKEKVSVEPKYSGAGRR